MSVFRDKVLLITGGTGSFGNAVLRRFLTSDIKEIRIFSRDEKKQDEMRHRLQAQHPNEASKVHFVIGNEMAGSPKIDIVSVTGSVGAGESIMAAALVQD